MFHLLVHSWNGHNNQFCSTPKLGASIAPRLEIEPNIAEKVLYIRNAQEKLPELLPLSYPSEHPKTFQSQKARFLLRDWATAACSFLVYHSSWLPLINSIWLVNYRPDHPPSVRCLFPSRTGCTHGIVATLPAVTH